MQDAVLQVCLTLRACYPVGPQLMVTAETSSLQVNKEDCTPGLVCSCKLCIRLLAARQSGPHAALAPSPALSSQQWCTQGSKKGDKGLPG